MGYATAGEIAKALGARRAGRGWTACCPAHEDRSPSFSIADAGEGRPLVYCHAGCDQRSVIAALRSKGLWGDCEGIRDPSRPLAITFRPNAARIEDERRRTGQALEIWDNCEQFRGSLAETYLRSRSIRQLIPALDGELRFAPSLRHPSGVIGPALVAAIRSTDGAITAVQRTWLATDGAGKADLMPNKMTLGPMGMGAVKLAPCSERLGLAEGIETAISATQIYQWPVWACLSAMRLSTISPPEGVRDLVIFADAGKVGVEEAFKAQDHFEAKGFSVEVITPAADFGDASDFNDALRGVA